MLFRKFISAVMLGAMVVSLTAAYAPAPKPVPASSLANQNTGKVLKIVADLWCPINCTPMDDEEGVGIDLVRKIFEPMGYTVDYLLMPWARALEEVRAGKIDAIIGANATDDATLVFPKESIIRITDDFYVMEGDDWTYSGIDSLEGRRIGVIKDYGYNDIITEYVGKHMREAGVVQEVGGGDALEQNIRKLLAGRINVVVESAPVMQYMLKRLGLQEKVKWAGGVDQGFVYLAFSPALESSPEEAKHFDRGIVELRKAGALPAMYERYGLKPPE